MNFFFAWRYFRSKKTTGAVNIIAWISVIAIAVGTAALIIVLSVFNGFEDLVKGLYKDFYADIRIVPSQGKTILLTPAQLQQLRQAPGIAAISRVAEEKAVLDADYQAIVFLKGVDEQYQTVNNIGTYITRGKYDLGTPAEPALVIGAGIENAAGIDVEKGAFPATIYLPNSKAASFNSADALNSYKAMPSGTFLIQQEFDNKYVFSNLGFVKFMLNMRPDEYSSVELKLHRGYDPEKAKSHLQGILGSSYTIQTRYEQNQSLYMVMQVEKWVIYVILSLILVVAAFNMIGALTMLVLEKQKDIAVLKAMGMNNASVRKIFLCEGLVLAGVGAFSGTLLALIACFIQLRFHVVGLGGGSFIIDYYPVKVAVTDILLVIGTVSIIALLAAWLPSRKASVQEFSLKS